MQFEDAGVAQQVHIRCGGAQQDGLFGAAQGLARREHLAFGEPRAIGGLKSIEQRLRDRRAVSVRSVGAALRKVARWRAHRRGRADLADFCRQRLEADIGRCQDSRPVAIERRRHVLVGGPHGGALRIQLWIVRIGVGESLFQSFRRSTCTGQRSDGDKYRRRRQPIANAAQHKHYATPHTPGTCTPIKHYTVGYPSGKERTIHRPLAHRSRHASHRKWRVSCCNFKMLADRRDGVSPESWSTRCGLSRNVVQNCRTKRPQPAKI